MVKVKNSFKTRIIVFLSVLILGFSVAVYSVYLISNGDWICKAGSEESSYKINVVKSRGKIYDCNLKPLVDRKTERIATILPTIDAANALKENLSDSEFNEIINRFSNNKPFKYNIGYIPINSENINVFDVPKRYEIDQTAAHVIGYLDESNSGIYGIEHSYDDYLKNSSGEINVRYKVDALGRALKGDPGNIENSFSLSNKGIVLTIDERIQNIAEKAANCFLAKGAIIVTEVPNCKIRACVSMPSFSPLNLSQALDDKNSPFINRSISSYNIGSIFKLVTAATALENGIPENYRYNCTGILEIEHSKIRCFNGIPHGDENLKDAIAYSCNTYFMDLCNKITPEQFLKLSKKLGFGKEIELAPDFISKKGNLPSIEDLKNKKLMANFSFGQGTLLGTPIQVSGLINTIASNGIYSEPQLIEGLVDENLNYTETKKSKTNRVFSKKTAVTLMGGMKESVDKGTSSKGKPSNNEAGAKTGTAETGIKKDDDKEIIQSWYAGFYPFSSPKYSIVIFAEDKPEGGNSCGPIFKYIADKI